MFGREMLAMMCAMWLPGLTQTWPGHDKTAMLAPPETRGTRMSDLMRGKPVAHSNRSGKGFVLIAWRTFSMLLNKKKTAVNPISHQDLSRIEHGLERSVGLNAGKILWNSVNFLPSLDPVESAVLNGPSQQSQVSKTERAAKHCVLKITWHMCEAIRRSRGTLGICLSLSNQQNVF